MAIGGGFSETVDFTFSKPKFRALRIYGRNVGYSEANWTKTSSYLADIIAVEGNPIDNISVIRKVKLVMKGGKIYFN